MISVVKVKNAKRRARSFSLGYSTHGMNSLPEDIFIQDLFVCLLIFSLLTLTSLAADVMWFLPNLCALLIIGTVPGSVCVIGVGPVLKYRY